MVQSTTDGEQIDGPQLPRRRKSLRELETESDPRVDRVLSDERNPHATVVSAFGSSI